MASSIHTLALLTCLFCFLGPVAAFGAGDIPGEESLDGYVWRHGDVATAVLLNLPVSFKTNWRFTKLEKQQVYFGNWLRDYSQVVDTGALAKLPEELLRVVVSVLAFMEFGLATNEFDVTQERLGVYLAVEHIDNPLGYPPDAKSLDNRLRGPVDRSELEIDRTSGMKNYIANPYGGWNTSVKYIRQMLQKSIQSGRDGQGDSEPAKKHQYEAFRTLGSALHTLEDFSAHSNFVELCLRKLGEEGVFPCVGDACRITAMNGKSVPPIVTGTFGSLDLLAALGTEGEIGQGELDELRNKLNVGSKSFVVIYTIIKAAINTISKVSFDNNNQIVDRMAKVADTAEEVKKDPGAFAASTKADKNNLVSGKNPLWEAMEPALMLHDEVSKWLDETSEEIGSYFTWITGPIDTVKGYIKDFVYKFIALLLEPMIDQMREAVKEGRDELNKKEKENPEESIFTAESKFSDPSHSILAKDHYANVLNTPAGLVATVCANWTTQQVVRCWDDSSIDAEVTIDKILKILHHPDFNDNNRTDIQRYMFEAVQNWWSEQSEDEKNDLRDRLTKDSVSSGKNNRKVTADLFTNKHRGAAIFDGSQPAVVDRPKTSKANELAQLIQRAAEVLRDLAGQVESGARAVVSFVDDTATDFSHVVDDTVGDVSRGIGEAVDKIGQGLNDVGNGVAQGANAIGNGIVDTAGNAGTTITNAANDAGDAIKNTVDDAGGTIRNVAENVAGDVQDTVQNVGNTIGGWFGR